MKTLCMTIVTLAAASVVACPATCQSKRRWDELRAEVSKTSATEAERVTVFLAVNEYMNSRNAWLQQLRDLARTDDPARLKGGWALDHSRFDTMAKFIGGASRDIGDGKPVTTDAMSKLLKRIRAEEYAFVSAIVTWAVPPHHEQITRIGADLTAYTRALQSKWEAMRQLDDNVDQQQQKVAGQITGIVDEMLKQAGSHEADLEKERQRIEGILADIDLPPVPGSDVASVLRMIVTVLKTEASHMKRRDATLLSLRTQFVELVRREESVHVMFIRARQDVEEFVRRTNFDRAEDAWKQAEKAADAARNQLRSNGQKDDFDWLRKEVLGELHRRLDATRSAYEEFVKRNKGIFFGPVGDEARKELLEESYWERADELWNRASIDVALKKHVERLGAARPWTSRRAGITDKERDYVRDQLERSWIECEACIEELRRHMEGPGLFGKLRRLLSRKIT